MNFSMEEKTQWKKQKRPDIRLNSYYQDRMSSTPWCAGVVLVSIIMCAGIILLAMVCPAQSYQAKTGKAAWYSKHDITDPWIHRTTTSGEAFNENELTCAMRSREFGKYYKITNLNNNKSVIVNHTDFGPAERYNGKPLNRIADLSKAAFSRIADLKDGVIVVSIEEI
jgi:rare lipoprotein A